MPRDASGYMRPGRDKRDADLTARERTALANENSGTTSRRQEVVSRRAAAAVTKVGTEKPTQRALGKTQ